MASSMHRRLWLLVSTLLLSTLQPTNGNTSYVYQCTDTCQCQYEPKWQKMSISCDLSQSMDQPFVTIDKGIRHLVITNATIGDSAGNIAVPPVGDNTLVMLELQSVTLNSGAFFESSLFLRSQYSLSSIYFNNVAADKSLTSFLPPPPANFFMEWLDTWLYDKEIPLQQFSQLQVLDTLMIRDSNALVSDLVIPSLPRLNHLVITNSSITTVDPRDFVRVSNQLISLELRNNKLSKIPVGWLQQFNNLTTLDLSSNQVEHLEERVFLGLENLLKLNLSRNSIQYIDAEVFVPLKHVHEIDLNHNQVIQIFEPYFESNGNLETLLMRDTWAPKMFSDSLTSSRTQKELERLVNSLLTVKTLDIRDNNMNTIPETLAHTPKLTAAYLGGNSWSCGCQQKWLPFWINTRKINLVPPSASEAEPQCYPENKPQQPLLRFLRSQICSQANIKSDLPRHYFHHVGQEVLLQCHQQNLPWPSIIWITPRRSSLRFQSPANLTEQESAQKPRMSVTSEGNLRFQNFTKADYGRYVCIAEYQGFNVTHQVHVGVDTTIFSYIRVASFIFGWIFAFACLLLVLIVQAVRSLLSRCGIECLSVGQTYQAKRLRTFLDTLEQSKTTQLDWLRENYNMQAQKIKDNCMFQLERIRDSYTVQHKNLSDIRDYGTSHLHQLRDQYCDQIRKVSGYSTHQLCKVRENYLFQRNRVCKFSSHQLLRLRESYKWQAHTLNKILENLPTLNLDTCRGIGNCGRTDSIYLEDMTDFETSNEIQQFRLGISDILLPLNPRERPEHVSLLMRPELLPMLPSSLYQLSPETPEEVKHFGTPADDKPFFDDNTNV